MLRTEFENLADSKAAHKADHLAMHYRHNATSSVDKPGTAAENATNIAAAIASVTIDRGSVFQLGGTVYIGPGDYALDDTVEIRQKMGLRFIGSGLATRFVWVGAANKPMFKLAHCRDVEFGHMLLKFSQKAATAVQLTRDNSAGSTITPVHNHIHHVWIDGRSVLDYGFRIDGVDANNDFNLFEHCEVANYRTGGWQLPTSQSYNNRMVNCRAIGDGVNSQYGVKTGANLAGTFHWTGGAMALNTAADFYVGRSYQPYIIEFVNSEASARFIHSDSYNTIRAVGCRYSAGALHADGDAIVVTGGGFPYHLTLEDCIMGDGPNPTAAMTMRFEGSDINYNKSGVVVRNCKIYSSAASVWSARTPHVVETSMQILNEGTLESRRLI